jgi:hypothetical protein
MSFFILLQAYGEYKSKAEVEKCEGNLAEFSGYTKCSLFL